SIHVASMKYISWSKLALEFLSIFIAVISAFALNNWNDNRRDRLAEDKILAEIQNGLQLDLKDIEGNTNSHQQSIKACRYFRRLVQGQSVSSDSLGIHYIMVVRDFTSIMNLSGYQSLKSKGLEIISNDSIRLQILALYDHWYQIIYKLEETAAEMQAFTTYFHGINEILKAYLQFDNLGNLVGIRQPLPLTPTEKNELLSYLWRIEINHLYKLQKYQTLTEQVNTLKAAIELHLQTE
ncbi:MAG: hypothetical protein AAFQ98_20525, partial [Bacteroidota bacterium]